MYRVLYERCCIAPFVERFSTLTHICPIWATSQSSVTLTLHFILYSVKFNSTFKIMGKQQTALLQQFNTWIHKKDLKNQVKVDLLIYVFIFSKYIQVTIDFRKSCYLKKMKTMVSHSETRLVKALFYAVLLTWIIVNVLFVK